MEGISLDFHCFKELNNNLEARLLLHVHFVCLIRSSDGVYMTMQLRFFKLGTVLPYAFNAMKWEPTLFGAILLITSFEVESTPKL